MALDTSGLYQAWPIGAEVRADGRAIAQAARDYGQLIIDTHSTWTALDGSFHSPQSLVDTALGAYDDLLVGGAAIGTVGNKVRDALVTYGDAVDDLQRDRRLAQQAAREFNASVASGDEIPASGSGSEGAVQQQIDSVMRRLQEAMDECATTLDGLELELAFDSFASGPVPEVASKVLKDGLGNLSFSDIEYTDFVSVETVRNPTIVNRLVNTTIDIDMSTNFPFVGVDVDTPRSSTSVEHTMHTRIETKMDFLLPAPMAWMGRLPSGLGDRYRARVDGDGRAHEVRTSRSRVREGGIFSRHGEVVRTTTDTWTDTSHQRWRPPADAPDVRPTVDGRAGQLTRLAGHAGVAGDVISIGFTYENAYNEHYERVSSDSRYALLSPDQRNREATENAVVTTVTDTGVDFAAGGAGAAIGAAFGGPVGAVAGFGIGLGLSWAADQDWFGGTSVKDGLSNAANDAVDWGKDRWNDWFG